MKRPYFTRKNLIIIALAFFYSFVLLFVGACLEGTHSIFSKKNPIALIANILNFESISCGVSGFLFLILVAIYISAFVAMFLYERRYAEVNQMKYTNPKILVSHLLTLLACLVLSVGLGVVIQKPLTGENIGKAFKYIGQCLALTTVIYVFLFALIGGIIMFIVNFVLVDKPFRSFAEKDTPNFDDDEFVRNDVTANFDESENVKAGNVTNVSSNIGISGGSASQEVVQTARELDDREKVFPALSTMDEEYSGYAVEKVESTNITLNELCVRFRNYLAKEEELYFDLDTIRFFISGFAASHFMILEGLSGTGKSSLPRYFAKFVNANLLFVPVQATWRDKSNLIGYFNDFAKTYTETEFLISLYHANYNPDMLHIFVLDEMNISRVEYYFADFLSVLEYPESEWKLKIMQLPYGFVPPAKLPEGIIQIPNNAFFVGTANKDDSTFTITDKVYDRAITIDFEERNIPFTVKEEVQPITLSKTKFEALLNEAKKNKGYQMNENDFEKFRTICDYIDDQFDITFGNRILNQISELVPVFVASGGKKEDALDFLLSRKVISKIEGRFEEYVKDALKGLLALIEKTYGASVLKRSEKTIQSLMRRL